MMAFSAAAATGSGMVVDTSHLMDAIEGYLFGNGYGPGVVSTSSSSSSAQQQQQPREIIDQHLVLGVSLGGHSTWQIMFADPRVTAGIAVIGCPDYMSECASLLSISLSFSSFPTPHPAQLTRVLSLSL